MPSPPKVSDHEITWLKIHTLQTPHEPCNRKGRQILEDLLTERQQMRDDLKVALACWEEFYPETLTAKEIRQRWGW